MYDDTTGTIEVIMVNGVHFEIEDTYGTYVKMMHSINKNEVINLKKGRSATMCNPQHIVYMRFTVREAK